MDGVAEQIQNLSFLTWDTGVIAIVLIAVFAYAYTIGKDFVATMIVSFYIASGIVAFAPMVGDLYFDVGLDRYVFGLIVLLVVFVVVQLVTTHNGYFEPYIVPSRWEVPVFCVLFAGLILAVASSYLPTEMTADLAPSTRWLFFQQWSSAVWLLAPIVAMIIIRGQE